MPESPDNALPSAEAISSTIHIVRNQRVMLDADLARLYGVPTRRLNEQVRRNSARFPLDFAFRLTTDECCGAMWSQFATTLRRTRRLDQPPWAFTEHGCLMASNILRSERAVQVSVLIVRAFVHMRTALAANSELAARVDELVREVGRQGDKLDTHDRVLRKLLEDIRRLTQFPEPEHRQIGFTAPWSK